MKTFKWLLSIAIVSALLAPSSFALPVSTDGLVVTSASVEVESVGTPNSWVPAKSVYEGSPARVVLAVDAPATGTARVTVTLPGVTNPVGESTTTISRDTSTISVPLDLSYGAWLAGSNQSPASDLDVSVSFTPSPQSQPLTNPVPESLPIPAVSPTPTTLPVASTTQLSTTEPIISSLRPVRIKMTGTTKVNQRSLRTVINSYPPSGSIFAVLRLAKSRAKDCPPQRQFERFINSITASSGRSVILLSGPTLPRGCAQLELRFVDNPQVMATSLTASTTFNIPLVIAPRPLILVHGMWSTASTWDTYTQAGNRLVNVHPHWRGYAVSTMDTGSPFLPYRAVNTVTQNAHLAWAFIRERMLALNAHEVDVAAHSLGGVITRRMLHDLTYGESAQDAIRSVVLLGTPNGGSSCSDAWAVPANSELTYSAMSTFNVAYPGYPGAFTTSLYSDHFSSTCFNSSSGDLFVPSWSTQAQSVNVVRQITPGIQHADMTSDARLFTDYVLPAVALPSAPTSAGPTTVLSNPTSSSTRLDDGSTSINPLAIERTVTIQPGQSLVASVVANAGASGTLQYMRGATPISIPLTAIGDLPVFEATASYAELGGISGGVTVTLAINAITSVESPEWRWTLVTRN